MTSIPINPARVPTLLSSQLMLSSLNRTNQQLLELQIQLASGKAVNRPSDDAIAASAITVLDDVLERRDQRLRNLGHGEAVLNTVDAALGEASDLLLEAKGIALSQIGLGSDPTTRAAEAEVIDALLTQLTNLANRQFQDMHLFGGNATGIPPMTGQLGGLRYQGQGSGLVTDLGLSQTVAITTAGDEVFGALSARVEGDRDLDPALTPDTRLVDLDGALGLGVRLGSIDLDVNGTALEVDLTGADRIEDVTAALQEAIATVDPGAVVQIDPAGGRALQIVPSAGSTVTVTDLSGSSTASDLGLTGTYSGPAGSVGQPLHARLTPLTPLSALDGLTVPPGQLRITNAGQTREIDLSGAQTVQDLINAIESAQMGVRAMIGPDGDRLHVVNELSGAAMSIGEVAGGLTATELGIRSLAASTALADFNDGRGVEIIQGSVDPVTGLPDPARDLDFQVDLKDGRAFAVDLAGAETAQDVIDAINAAAASAGVVVPAEFGAALAADGNGIALTDATPGVTTSVTALNGSAAAEQLGILGSTDGATLIGQDRATVAVDSVFSHLITLRDALRADDERGIAVAAQGIENDIARVARSRAEVGVSSRRVSDATRREEDLRIQDMALRSQLQDLDFTEAAVAFTSLQQQLEAALATTRRVSSLSLLDFLG